VLNKIITERRLGRNIGINTPNPHDVTPAEAEEIANAIRGLNPAWNVTVTVTERTGYGVTWFEVLRIALTGGAFVGKEVLKEAAKKIADIAVEWARERVAVGYIFSCAYVLLLVAS
jgi:hypothetical protein